MLGRYHFDLSYSVARGDLRPLALAKNSTSLGITHRTTP